MPLQRSVSVFFAVSTAALGVLIVRAPNPEASQSTAAITDSASTATPLILQENDGEHRLRRPGGPTGSSSVSEFIIKIDKQNGHAEDFYVATEILKPGAMIPLNKHDNAEQALILEEGGATVSAGDKRAEAGPHSIVFVPRNTWMSITNTGSNPIHLYAVFSRQGFENFLRARSARPGESLTPLTPEEVHRAEVAGYFTPWDTAKGPYPPGVGSQSTTTQSSSGPAPLILQEDDGEHRLRRPGGPAGSGSVPGFIIKIDKQNGNAEDFYVGYEILNPGAMIPFHKHHNSEEVVIFEEGGATVTVGDKRAVAGPHSIVFIPRETWVSITNKGDKPIRGYYLFSRQGFENFLRARSVRPGEPLTPLTPEEVRRAAEDGHVMPWDTSKARVPTGRTTPLT
ncbi:MAG: cupin domain-containing protein [Candidatus Acidiferrum sp.]